MAALWIISSQSLSFLLFDTDTADQFSKAFLFSTASLKYLKCFYSCFQRLVLQQAGSNVVLSTYDVVMPYVLTHWSLIWSEMHRRKTSFCFSLLP